MDWHSHPGYGPGLAFSPTDDHYEAAQAVYLAHRMDGVPYGSVVVNDTDLAARLWLTAPLKPSLKPSLKGHIDRSNSTDNAVPDKQTVPCIYRPTAQPLHALFAGDLQSVHLAGNRQRPTASVTTEQIFDRQVRAFGTAFQQRMRALRVGIVGLGGMGSALVEYLTRLGAREWVLVDADTVELSNLNRLVHASLNDAQTARPKVNVGRSIIHQVSPQATVRALATDVFDRDALHALKSCDLLIAATDNHSSRMALNRLAVQYLIPLVHVGFNISVDIDERTEERVVSDVSGEFAIPDLGRWCLHCAGLYDPQQAGWELASPAQRALLKQRGYVSDTPAPAVRHLDGLVAALAAAEIHNLVHAYKPQQRYLVYDALKSALVPLQVTPGHNCPVCSPEHGVLGLGDLEPLPDYRRANQVKLPPTLPAQSPEPPPASETCRRPIHAQLTQTASAPATP